MADEEDIGGVRVSFHITPVGRKWFDWSWWASNGLHGRNSDSLARTEREAIDDARSAARWILRTVASE